MKKLVSFTAALFFICFLSKSISAQGNLQFNAVKYYSFSVTQIGSTTLTENTVSITVPANKVWKIESASANYYFPGSNSSSMGSQSGGTILIDGKLIFQTLSSGSGAFTIAGNTLPLWLPAGTYVLSLKSGNTSSGNQYVGYVSAIEFNVVP